jgi:bacterioferritin (cytochrome b1)
MKHTLREQLEIFFAKHKNDIQSLKRKLDESAAIQDYKSCVVYQAKIEQAERMLDEIEKMLF